MTLELDHVLVCASAGAPEGDALVRAGIREGSPNRHPGQGTANRRFFFRNSFLELIWIEDEDEARSDLVAPTRLWDRWRWRDTGVSPFGICLRSADDDLEEPPFATFDYKPPYIPSDLAIPIATETRPHEPMILINPIGGRPEVLTHDAAQPTDHPNGVDEITHVRLGIPNASEVSSPVERLVREGFVSVGHSPEHVMIVSFDDKRQGQRHDFQPVLPLILHW